MLGHRDEWEEDARLMHGVGLYKRESNCEHEGLNTGPAGLTQNQQGQDGRLSSAWPHHVLQHSGIVVLLTQVLIPLCTPHSHGWESFAYVK